MPWILTLVNYPMPDTMMHKFRFELDGIDTDALFGMINGQRNKYMINIIDTINGSGHDTVLTPAERNRVCHLMHLIRNVDSIETTVFGQRVNTNLSHLEAYGCTFDTFDFPPD